MTSRLILFWAQRQGGAEAAAEVVRRAGLSGREEELRDENAWFSYDNKIRLFEALVEVFDDPHATRRAGASALDFQLAEGLKLALRALGSPRMIYQHIVQANGKFSARHQMELEEIGSDHARLRFTDRTGAPVHRLDCEYNIGLLSCIPGLFGQPPARISHPVCGVDGRADACVYDVAWRGGGSLRNALACGLGAAATLITAAVADPALVAPAGGVAALAFALAGYRAFRGNLAHWRELDREAGDQAALTDRLTDSLQDLVSELRLEELLDKIVRNARAAVNGKEFALLVEEDGVLRCRATTGLPDASIARLEAWAAQEGRTDEQLLIEDVAVVPPLAALAHDPDLPMATVCAAPLRYRGETAGLLLALARTPRAFLPRDVELVRSYAAQAAIALTNARLFAAQHALATRDPLTGLLNHREFHESLDRELERCRRYGGHATVVMLDLDGFKLVNDSGGHAEGDRVLREAARALAGACREADVAFRVGGDEFALLLPATPPDEARAVAERVCEAISAADSRTSASFGLASWPENGWSKDVVLAQADGELYAMKGADRRRRRRTEGSAELGAAHQRERLAMASRLSGKLAPILSPEQIVRETVAELHHSFDYYLAYVHRLEGEALHVVAVGGTICEEHDVPRWSQRLDQGVCGRVARTGVRALVHNAALDPDHVGAELVNPDSEVELRSQLAVPLRAGDRVWGVLSIEDPELGAFSSDDVLLLETVAAQVSAALHRGELFVELEGAFASTLGVLADALEARDLFTASQARAVSELARAVGTRLGLPEDELRDVAYAGLLHDIGKLGVRTELLTKPGPLTAEEEREMRRHPEIGAEILQRIPFFAAVHRLVRASHERWDGAGYPDGLAGDAIPLGSRIIAACDAYLAMTSARPFRDARSAAEAVAELRTVTGSQLDPVVVEALLHELEAAG